MATGKQLKAAILARRAAKGPRKKRTRPEPRQYTVADLERARDRVAAAERRIDNDRKSNPNRGRAGLERAQLELSVIESQLRLRGLLRHDDDDEGKTRPGNQAHVAASGRRAPLSSIGRLDTRAGRRRCKSARGPKADRCSQSHFGRVRRRKNLFNYATYILWLC